MDTTRQYTVGGNTRRLLDAYFAFQDFKNKYLDALCEIYGEEQGDKLFNESWDEFNYCDNIVWEYLKVQFNQNRIEPDTVEVTI